MTTLRLLLLSTPVGPLGSGLGGGVEFTLTHLAKVLAARGHRITVAAPAGSVLPFAHQNIALVQIPGGWQTTAQHQGRSASVRVAAVLANLWRYGQQVQADYDLLVNFAYDWLPFYLTPFLTTPVAHFVSMGSLSDVMDEAVAAVSAQRPGGLGSYTQAQAETFKEVLPEAWTILGCGLDLSQYSCCENPDDFLAWVGRIAPEKGLEDAVSAVACTQRKLKIFGKIEDVAYWQTIQQQIERVKADVEYCGFFSNTDLPKHLRSARAMLMTPKWIEAFGIVAIESLACGVPVIAYARGGLAEIVGDGKNGWLVAPDSIDGLCQAIARIPEISRRRCREQAELNYSLSAWGDRWEQWFYQLLSSTIASVESVRT
ncbi:MAG: glycosyltransferase [Cyanobacteria bacterium P01_D01_bin.105]